MADAALAALVWLMNPTQAPDLPRRQIVATSYAALNPPEAVWRKYLTEIRRLQDRGELTEAQVGLLLFSPNARLELMHATSGDADAFVEGTVAQVLRHAEATARAEVESELESEKARRAQAEDAMAEEKQRAVAAAAELAAVTAAHTDQIGVVAKRISVVISWIVLGLVLPAIVAGTLQATGGLFPESSSDAIPLGSAFLVLAVIMGLCSLIWGWTVLDFRRWVDERFEPPIERLLRGWFSPSTSD